MKRIYWLVILIVTTNFSFAQTGAWLPAGADTSFPRTICRSTDITNIQSTLSSASILPLFINVYRSAQLTIPVGSTDAERLSTAHIAKNAAFVAFIGKKVVDGQVTNLPADEKDTLLNKVKLILETFATAVDRITVTQPAIYDSWQWRSKELIDLSIAYDLLRASGKTDAQLSTAKSRLQEFAGHLYDESTRLIAPPLYPIRFFDVVFNNHSLMTAAALGTAAIVINTAVSNDATQQPLNWISTAMWNMENIFFLDTKRQSESEELAGYAEGPGYLRYSMLNCLPFMRAMGYFAPAGSLAYTYKSGTRVIANPFTDARYDNLFDWIAKIRMPDGRLPVIEDTYMHDFFPELALTGKSKYQWANSFSRIVVDNSLNAQLTFAGSDSRVNYIASLPSMGAAEDSLFYTLPVSGSLVFKSASDSNATYMHVTAEKGIARESSFGHNQADVSSFSLYHKGELLALDPGYIRYDRRAEVGNAQNHNMILVDSTGPAIGEPANSNDVDGFIGCSFTRPSFDFGEVTTNYAATDINRNFIFVRKKYFVLTDYLTAVTAHNYTWQLHGFGVEGGSANNNGLFTENFAGSSGLWSKGTEHLTAHVAVSGGNAAFTKVLRPHEYSYDSVVNHHAMYVVKSGAQNTNFLSVLYPYSSGSPNISTLTESPLSAVAIEDDNFIDITAAQNGSSLQMLDTNHSPLPENLYANARLVFYSHNKNNSNFAQWFVKDADSLLLQDNRLFISSARAHAQLTRQTATSFLGYISQACTASYYINKTVSSVSGNNVHSWQQSVPGHVQVIFTGESNFTIIANEVLPVELQLFNAVVAGETVLLNWETASEINAYGFTIERLTGTGGWSAIGFVPAKGNSAAVTRYQFSDPTVQPGIVHYRLKQIDLDGSYTHSASIMLNITSPASFVLLQNYPNPFNPETKIAFTTPIKTSVRLQVYNILGEVVRIIVNSEIAPGKHEVFFNATGLPSGIYYAKLEAANFRKTIKMILQK